MRVIYLLVIAVLSVLLTTASCQNVSLADDNVIRIGILEARGGSYDMLTKQLDISYEIWLERNNAKNDGKGIFLVNKYYKFEFVKKDGGSADGTLQNEQVAALSQQMCRGDFGRIDFVITPYSSGLATITARECEPYGIPSVTGNAAGNNVYRCDYETPGNPDSLPADCKDRYGERRWNWAISVDAQAQNYFPNFISLMKIKGAQDVFLFYEDAYFPATAARGVRLAANDLNMPIVADQKVPRMLGYIIPDNASPVYDSRAPVKDSDLLATQNLVRDIINVDADAVTGGTYYDLCHNLLILLKDKNYLPNALALNSCLGSAIVADLPDIITFIYGPSAWDKRLKGKAYSELATNPTFDFPYIEGQPTTAQQYLEAFRSHTLYTAYGINGDPEYQAVGGYVCGYAIFDTLRQAQSFDKYQWLTKWQGVNMDTVYGPIILDNAGHNFAKEYIIWQVDAQNTLQIVAPLSSASLDGIYPIPSFDDRVYDDAPYAKTVDLAFVIIVSILLFFNLLLMGLIGFWHDKPQIMASSVLFCELIMAGAAIAYVSLFFWTVYTTTVGCNVFLWVITLGFDLMLGSLLIKNWRIYQVFKLAESLKKVMISNLDLLKAVVGVMLFDIIVVIVWEAAFPITAVRITPDLHRPALDYYICHSLDANGVVNETAETVFVSVLGAYKAIQLIAGAVLAFNLRKAPQSFNEAKYIGYALYNFLFCLVLLLVVWLTIPEESYEIATILRCVIVLWGITMCLVSIFVPKIYFVLTGAKKAGSTSMMSATSRGSSASDHSTGDSKGNDQEAILNREVKRLRDENASLQKRIAILLKADDERSNSDYSRSSSQSPRSVSASRSERQSASQSGSGSKAPSASYSQSGSQSGSVSNVSNHSNSRSVSASPSGSISASASGSISGSASASASGSASGSN